MSGYDKIKNLYLEIEQKNKDNALVKIVTFLMKQPNMGDLYLKEEKNLEDMMQYVKNKAKETAVNNVAVIEDDVVYQWVNEYFSKSNEELGIPKKEISNKSNNIKHKDIEIKDNNQLKLDL